MTLAERGNSFPTGTIEEHSPVSQLVKWLRKVDGSLDALPEPSTPCGGCSGHVVKAVVPYDYDSDYPDGTRLTVARMLPGYRCERCGAEYGAATLTDEFLKHVASGLAELGDTRLKANLERAAVHPSSWTTLTPLPEVVKEKLNRSGE